MSEPLRIAYLTSAYGRPSDTFIRNEVDQLRRLGVEVTTFSVRRPPAPPFEDPDVARHRAATEYLLERGVVGLAGATVSLCLTRPLRAFTAIRAALRTRAPGLSGLARSAVYFAEAAWFARRLRALRVDHVHNHIAENSANVAMLASVIADAPFSMTVHGPFIFYAPEKWSLGEKISASAFTIAITNFCKSQCMVFTPLEAWDRLRVVRCSVQEPFVDAELATAPPADPPELVAVGRLCAEKGQVLLLDAVKQLADEGRRFRLRLVGDGPMRGSVEQRIAELGLGDRVVVEGWRSSADVRDALRTATALVMPSFAEGLPIVLMEALALRVPVVTTIIAGVPELIEDGVNGWLAPAGSADLFADALRRALETPPETRATMGEAGRRRVLEAHHPAEQAKKLLTLFRESARK